MYNFTVGLIILSCTGFGFYQWDSGGLVGKLVAVALLGFAVLLFQKWERRLFGD